VPTPSTGPATPAAEARCAAHDIGTGGQTPGAPAVHTDTMLAEIDTQGGDIVYLELLQHKDTLHETKNFVLFGPEHRYVAQSGLIGEGLPNHRTLFHASAGNSLSNRVRTDSTCASRQTRRQASG